MRVRNLPILLLIFYASVDAVNAELTTIYDSGRTRALEETYSIEGMDAKAFGMEWLTEHRHEFLIDDPFDIKWLPLETKMVPAQRRMKRRVNYTNLSSPICIVGSDPFSLRWIRRAKPYLKQNKAVCWIVQANNPREFNAVAQQLTDIMFMPADGDAISTFYNIDFYPVLITDRYISQ